MSCLWCQDELGEFVVWRDADGETHWIHTFCLAEIQQTN